MRGVRGAAGGRGTRAARHIARVWQPAARTWKPAASSQPEEPARRQAAGGAHPQTGPECSPPPGQRPAREQSRRWRRSRWWPPSSRAPWPAAAVGGGRARWEAGRVGTGRGGQGWPQPALLELPHAGPPRASLQQAIPMLPLHTQPRAAPRRHLDGKSAHAARARVHQHPVSLLGPRMVQRLRVWVGRRHACPAGGRAAQG